MKTAGIICEYNPFHRGHQWHIEQTRAMLGGDSAVVCVMSGNFVQRGDFAVFNKLARAKMAVLCGADLVVELPVPYALSSAEGFASAGVSILDNLGVCGYISFGSESGDIGELYEAAEALVSEEAAGQLKAWLGKGLSYASAQQKAADAVMGKQSAVLKSPNNMLGIEYLKALTAAGSPMRPITVKRAGGGYDGGAGLSASFIRERLLRGKGLCEGLMPETAAGVFGDEILAGRGPVSMANAELAVLSRLRALPDFIGVPGVSEGLDRRFKRFVASEPAVGRIMEQVKTKRYAASRIRRVMLCACLGVTASDTLAPPPYIRVLSLNRKGMALLREIKEKGGLPVITKPASARKLAEGAARMFELEAAATDFYTLAYPCGEQRIGGSEWLQTPAVII